MVRSSFPALFAGLLLLTGSLLAQDNKPRGEKKDDPPAKVKGTLPANWKSWVSQILKFKRFIRFRASTTMRSTSSKPRSRNSKRPRQEMKAVLTPEQKKRLDDIATGKEK